MRPARACEDDGAFSQRMERELERRDAELRREGETRGETSGSRAAPRPAASGEPDGIAARHRDERELASYDGAAPVDELAQPSSLEVHPPEARVVDAAPTALDAPQAKAPGGPSAERGLANPAPARPNVAQGSSALSTTTAPAAGASTAVSREIPAPPAPEPAATPVVSPVVASDAIFGGPEEAAPAESWTAAEGAVLEAAEAASAGESDLQHESAEARTARAAGDRASATVQAADSFAELEAPRTAHPPSAEAAPQAVKPGAEAALLDALGEARTERAERFLGSEQGAEVLKQVRLHLAPGLREATLHLQPAWLGRVTIKIAVRSGRARAELRAERAEALEALERHLPELRAALADRGFEDAEVDLALGLGDPSGARAPKTPAGRSRHLALPLALAATLAGAAGIELQSPAGLRSARAVDTYA